MASEKANDANIGVPPRRADLRPAELRQANLQPAEIRGRAGITTDPERRKNRWKRMHPDMSNWQETGPFLSRKDAHEWEKAQAGYEPSVAFGEPDHPFVLWYGYRFDYAPERDLLAAAAVMSA